jgi:hypothetical protein
LFPLSVITALLLLASGPLDPRLATVRSAYVEAVDDLGDDQGVAVCLAEHLDKLTPIKLASTKEQADVILRVKAHLPSTTTKFLVGVMGGSPSADLTAQTPDGTALWSDGAKYRRSMGPQGKFGSASSDTGKSIECGLADELLNTLRDAMRKARDQK